MVTLSEYKDRKLLKVIQKQKNEFIKKMMLGFYVNFLLVSSLGL